MHQTETISFREFYKEMAELRQARCIEEEDDIVMAAVGAEGSGKSTGSLGLGGIDPNFYRNYWEKGEQIYFLWSHFLEANDAATRYANEQKRDRLLSMAGEANTARISEEFLKKYNLKPEDLSINDRGKLLEPGSYRQYDESGTQMFNRDAMSKPVKDQIKMFISNRSNRGIYALNVPKAHYLDKYIREERIKYLILYRKTYEDGDIRHPKRVAYIWGKDRINLMRSTFGGYWTTVIEVEFGKAYKLTPPNYRIQLPNLIGEYVPENINAKYQYEKTHFQTYLSKEMRGENTTEKKDDLNAKYTMKTMGEALPKWGENYKEYEERTTNGKTTYYKHVTWLRANGIWPSPSTTPL